jgi:hypothetical protein
MVDLVLRCNNCYDKRDVGMGFAATLISGFYRNVDEICTLVGYYVA